MIYDENLIDWCNQCWKIYTFNRLIGQFRAIVTDIHGTTIDILAHTLEVDRLGKIIFMIVQDYEILVMNFLFIEKIVKIQTSSFCYR